MDRHDSIPNDPPEGKANQSACKCFRDCILVSVSVNYYMKHFYSLTSTGTAAVAAFNSDHDLVFAA